MPSLPPVNGVLRARFIGNINGISAGWRWYFGTATTYPMSAGNLSNFAEELRSLCGSTGLVTNMISNFHLTQVQCEDLSTGSVALGVSTGPTVSGGGSSPPAAGTAMLMSLAINSKYRGGHPRTYFPPPTSSDLADPQHWTTAIVGSQLTNAISVITTALAHSSATALGISHHVVVRYRSGHTLLTVPEVFTVQSWTINTPVASQRRRQKL